MELKGKRPGIEMFVADESELNVKDDKKGFTRGVWGLADFIRSRIPLLIIHWWERLWFLLWNYPCIKCSLSIAVNQALSKSCLKSTKPVYVPVVFEIVFLAPWETSSSFSESSFTCIIWVVSLILQSCMWSQRTARRNRERGKATWAHSELFE